MICDQKLKKKSKRANHSGISDTNIPGRGTSSNRTLRRMYTQAIDGAMLELESEGQILDIFQEDCKHKVLVV